MSAVHAMAGMENGAGKGNAVPSPCSGASRGRNASPVEQACHIYWKEMPLWWSVGTCWVLQEVCADIWTLLAKSSTFGRNGGLADLQRRHRWTSWTWTKSPVTDWNQILFFFFSFVLDALLFSTCPVFICFQKSHTLYSPSTSYRVDQMFCMLSSSERVSKHIVMLLFFVFLFEVKRKKCFTRSDSETGCRTPWAALRSLYHGTDLQQFKVKKKQTKKINKWSRMTSVSVKQTLNSCNWERKQAFPFIAVCAAALSRGCGGGGGAGLN